METSSQNLWEEEYRRGGIPSSVRQEPSGAVVKFVRECISERKPGLALDIGCGSGRNSIFLAEQGYAVTALDYAPSQIEKLKSATQEFKLDSMISAIIHDIRTPWPVSDGHIDVVIDAFCFKHQITEADIGHYVRELVRVGNNACRFMLSFAGRDDGYYSQFPVQNSDGLGQVIVDPQNGIASRLYDIPDILQVFGPNFSVLSTETKRMKNSMHGGAFDRVTHVIWWEKR